jgi:hypothetical protein
MEKSQRKRLGLQVIVSTKAKARGFEREKTCDEVVLFVLYGCASIAVRPDTGTLSYDLGIEGCKHRSCSASDAVLRWPAHVTQTEPAKEPGSTSET